MQPYNPNCARGIDVSHNNGEIDWQTVRASGISFAYIKATEGVTVTDARFAKNVAGAKAAGLMVGAYHYFHGTAPSVANQEAAAFIAAIEAVGGWSVFDLPPMLDVEAPELPADGSLPALCRRLLDTVDQSCGQMPLVYASPGFAADHLDNSLAEDGYPLWIAHYTDADQPAGAPGWEAWTFWQYSENGRVAGIDGDVDLDRYAGTEEELRAMAEGKLTDYPDVEAGRWSEASIAAVSKLGLMTAYEDGTFRPAEPVTREQLAKVVNDLVYMIKNP